VTSTDFRFSRFDPAWRLDDGTWPAGVWTDVSDFLPGGSAAGNLVEYLDVERRYVDTISDCLADGLPVVAERVEPGAGVAEYLGSHGLLVRLPDRFPALSSVDDLRSVARACMRSQIWCELVSQSGRVVFGHDLYVHVRASTPSDATRMRGAALRHGLFVDSVPYLEFDE
jgi:hypothetical protein